MAAGVGFVLLTCLIWAAVPLFIHHALATVDPLTVALFRLVTAGLVFAVLGRGLWRRVVTAGDAGRWTLLAAVGLGVNYVAFNGGILLTSVSLTVLIMQTQAVFTAVFSAWLLGERFGRRKLAGAAVAVGGSIMVVWGQQGGGVSGETALWGIAVVVLAAGAWGFFMVAQKRLQQAVGHLVGESEHRHVFAILGPIFLGGAAAGAAAWPVFPTYGQPWTPELLVVLVGVLGLAGTALAYFLLVRGMERIPVSTASILLNLMPVMTVALAYVLLQEKVTAVMALGGVLTILGSMLVVLADRGGLDQPVPAGAGAGDVAVPGRPSGDLR